MEYVIGSLVVMFVGLGYLGAYMSGRIDGERRALKEQLEAKVDWAEPGFLLDEERARQAADRAARQQQAFDDMMTYNPTIAMKGGKPSESND